MTQHEIILEKIKQLLLDKGFVEKVIKSTSKSETNYVLGDMYCIPRYVGLLGFLVEYAYSHNDAKNHGYEDGDSFPLNIGEDGILNGIEEEIIGNMAYHSKKF